MKLERFAAQSLVESDGEIVFRIEEILMQMALQMDKFGDNQANNPVWYKSEEAVKKHFGVKE